MASPLTIPGVQVRTEFEPTPVLPGATGILGIIGVTDRGPQEPTPVGSFSEFLEIFGPASQYTMPELRTAFVNGVFRAYVSRTAAGRGSKASLTLSDSEGEAVVRLEARAEGEWGNRIAVRVTPVRTLSGRGVKYVQIEVLVDGEVVESFDNLVVDPRQPDDLFRRLNSASRVLVAFDPLFEKALPGAIAATPLEELEGRPATVALESDADEAVLQATAKRIGPGGNQASISLQAGRAERALTGASDAPSVLVQAREPGPTGAQTQVTVNAVTGGVNIVVAPAGSAARTLGPFDSVEAIVAAFANDPDVTVRSQGTALPSPAAAAPLRRTVTVTVHVEGRDPRVYEDRPSLAAIAEIDDPTVRFTAVESATALPALEDGVNLVGGRNRGAALALTADGGEQPLLELVPAPNVAGPVSVAVTRSVSSIDGTTAVANLEVLRDGESVETHRDLTMDPDDPRYLPAVLEESNFVRAYDLIVRSRTTSLPAAIGRPRRLEGGSSPSVDDYQAALDRLELAEEVDLVLASAHHQLSAADVRRVHQAIVAHCSKMAEVARSRIGLGSIAATESAVRDTLDHATDVRSDHFILVAPHGAEAATAGLLGRQDYFKSPTFKTVASLGVPAGNYSDAQLTQLLQGNVCVVNERRGRGVIVVKGLLTSGRQINVQRTVNKAVRDVKALSDNYIGLLNNAGTRNALQQQAHALLLQMEKDGALVPSTDGSDPAFKVNVHSTQNDFTLGIVRVDIALRPVRAIDYIYATIFVQN